VVARVLPLCSAITPHRIAIWGWLVSWFRRWQPWWRRAPYNGGRRGWALSPLCLAIGVSGRCSPVLVCPMVCRWRPWVRSPLRCEASRGSGGGGIFLPVARLMRRILVGALWCDRAGGLRVCSRLAHPSGISNPSGLGLPSAVLCLSTTALTPMCGEGVMPFDFSR
jgi:hypothetical protein